MYVFKRALVQQKEKKSERVFRIVLVLNYLPNSSLFVYLDIEHK